MNLCNLALIVLIAALVFYLFTACCTGKSESFCPGNCVVKNMNSGCLPGVGRSDCPDNCPKPKYLNPNYVGKQYEQKYYIEGMDSREKIANYVAGKAIQNRTGGQCGKNFGYDANDIEGFKEGMNAAASKCKPLVTPDQAKFAKAVAKAALQKVQTCEAKDNMGPAGFPMGCTNDGSGQWTGKKINDMKANYAKKGTMIKKKEGFEPSDSLYDEFDADEQPDKKDKEQFSIEVDPRVEETNACGLPLCMSSDRCADPNTYVYDRQISVVSRSRTYGQGNYLLGDLPICPADTRDSYGHDWFRPSARPSADLNAGALRFMAPDSVNITNITGDINAYRSDGCGTSNVGVQYTLAG